MLKAVYAKRKHLFVFGLMILLAAGYAVARHKMLYHFRVVEPGVLYRSGSMSSPGLKWAHAKYGFETIINLREEREREQGSWYEAEKAFAEAHGVDLIDIPVIYDNPPTREQVEQILSVVADPDRRPVLVHCRHGVLRTGIVVALYEIVELGGDADEVIKEMPTFGHSFDDKEYVLDYIRNFRPPS